MSKVIYRLNPMVLPLPLLFKVPFITQLKNKCLRDTLAKINFFSFPR